MTCFAGCQEQSIELETYYLHLYSNRYDIYTAASNYGASENREAKKYQCVATISFAPGARIYADLPNHYEPEIHIDGVLQKRGDRFEGNFSIWVQGVDVATSHDVKGPVPINETIAFAHAQDFHFALSDKEDGYDLESALWEK